MRALCVLIGVAVIASSTDAGWARDPVLSVDGACPGQLRVAWEGAEPNRAAALLFSRVRGAYTIAGGAVCGGTMLGLGTEGLRLHRRFDSGPEGAGEMDGTAVPASCGGYLQIVVIGSPCSTSNVVQIPQ